MKKAVSTILDTLKVFFLFVFCTILFYFGLQWLDHNYESFHKYDEPNDGAVKVFKPAEQDQPTKENGPNRFFQFLRNGE
jgi:TRAP-type mannitol/chloroaromatic compound transport system permease small subunit